MSRSQETARRPSVRVMSTVIAVHVRHDLCGLNRGQLIEFVRDKFGFLESHRLMVLPLLSSSRYSCGREDATKPAAFRFPSQSRAQSLIKMDG